MSVNNEYTGDSIKVLKGLEAVKKRPGMYIGTTSQRGLHHLIYEIVDNSIDEAMAGVCNKVDVIFYKDGSVSGIGALIQTMTRMSHMPEVYALLLLVIVIGIFQDVCLKFIDKILFPSKYNRKSLF